MNELASILTPPQHDSSLPVWSAETMESAVHANGCCIIHNSVLTAQIDLSLCRDETSWEGKAILDFTVLGHIPDDLRDYVLNVLVELMRKEEKNASTGSLIVEHSAYVWVLQQADLPNQQ